MNHFDPVIHLQDIVLVGAGGTGAHLARSIARILYDMKQRNMHLPRFTIVDPDHVSLSNVGRQAFTVNQVGEPKAVTLARRFNLTLGLEINAICAPFHAKRHINRSSSTLIVGAVDNAAARRSIAEAEALTLDLGNHRDNGQLCLGNYHDASSVQECLRHSKDGNYRNLPSPYVVFPALLEDEVEPVTDTTLSCAQLVAASEQHLLINDMMATMGATLIYRLLHREKITHWLSFATAEPSITSIEVSSTSIRHYARIKDTKKGATAA